MKATKQYKGSGPRSFEPYEGVLLIDKPTGMTSHDVVDAIRRKFKIKKVGHGGTLDPMATGLLAILLGHGTKFSQQMMGSDKTYEGTMHLGAKTDTQDAEGVILEEHPYSSVSEKDIYDEFNSWVGDHMQTPPMVSAIKQNGVPLYKLARQGKTVEREPRLIHIYSFSLTAFSPPLVSFRLRCTKGTYVRTLCHDIGEKLGCGAYLNALRRTESGPAHIDKALPLEKALDMSLDELSRHVVHVTELRTWQDL